MRPTRFGIHGAVFWTVMCGAFYAAPYSNLFFLLLGFLTLLGIAGVAGARRNLRGVTAALAELPPVPSDVAIQVGVPVRAPARPRFQVRAILDLAGGARLAGDVDCLEGSATLALTAPALPRGAHVVERATLESTYPFGLVRVSRPFDAPAELLVYPAPHAAFEGRSAADALDDLLGHGDPGAGDLQPASLRDHRDGDDVRGVHWRASARRGRLVVQEWEGGSGQGLEVALDLRCSGEELEEALSTVSALVHLARASKETLRVHSQAGSATWGDGHGAWTDALRFLAKAEALPASAPAPPAVSPNVARLPRAAA